MGSVGEQGDDGASVGGVTLRLGVRAAAPAGANQVKPTSSVKCPSLRVSRPPPAQCTIQASRMMARTISTSHAKNSTMPAMAYPATVLVVPWPPATRRRSSQSRIDGLGYAGRARSSTQNVQFGAQLSSHTDGRLPTISAARARQVREGS
jgi:hypothetical protein